MSVCRSWLTASLATAEPAARKRFAGAAVLGDSSFGFVVELQDATQFDVGRQHCKYCARAEALMKLRSEMDRNEHQECAA